jgi:hypothetical protein
VFHAGKHNQRDTLGGVCLACDDEFGTTRQNRQKFFLKLCVLPVDTCTELGLCE